MIRVKDYIQFAVRFVGLGYIALWPLTAHDNGIAAYLATFNAFAVCGQSFAVVDLICDPPQLLSLSPGLHLIGMLSAAYVMSRLLLRKLCRRSQGRRPVRGPTATSDPAPQPTVPLSQSLRHRFTQQPPPPRAVRPRSHFGLRGAPH